MKIFHRIFQTFQIMLYFLWGEKDTATSLESGKKMASLLKKSTFTSYDGDRTSLPIMQKI
ncbi:MAG: hypothetical protein U5K55_16575 [Aliarcobacter sp.]|nr:hypothetical protein [Aliarcobacter sp.]